MPRSDRQKCVRSVRRIGGSRLAASRQAIRNVRTEFHDAVSRQADKRFVRLRADVANASAAPSPFTSGLCAFRSSCSLAILKVARKERLLIAAVIFLNCQPTEQVLNAGDRCTPPTEQIKHRFRREEIAFSHILLTQSAKGKRK